MTTITLTAVESKNIDTTTLRGSASLADLARLTQVDVFDQEDNPNGLQRDLSKKHAVEAYEYAARPKNPKLPRAYPEVVLNVRDRKVIVDRKVIFDGPPRLVALTFDLDKLLNARTTKVSRVDGNHRLIFGGGDGNDRPPLEKVDIPFQLHIGLTREQETALFSDVNANQKGLNTSHLEILRSRITPVELEQELHPDRAIAARLATDIASPFHGLVHMGGSRVGTKKAGHQTPVTFVALEHGVRRMLRALHIGELEFDARYTLIRNYWQAVNAVYPEAWNGYLVDLSTEDEEELANLRAQLDEAKSYLILKNLGINTLSQVGAMVADRCLIAGKVEVGHMVPMLRAAKGAVDWHKDSRDVAGMSGNRAVLQLAGDMIKKLPKSPEDFDEPTGESA